MPKIDLPEISAPKPTHEYVTVPEFNLFDMPHDPITINGTPYGPGTHYLPTELASTVKERLQAYSQANVRILQPRPDMKSQQLLDRGRGSATTNF